jgi:hypothetical protein
VDEKGDDGGRIGAIDDYQHSILATGRRLSQ